MRVISAFSPVPLPEVSGFLGEQMEFRKAKGPGQPLPVPEPHMVKVCRPVIRGQCGRTHDRLGAGFYDHSCLHVSCGLSLCVPSPPWLYTRIWVAAGRCGAR